MKIKTVCFLIVIIFTNVNGQDNSTTVLKSIDSGSNYTWSPTSEESVTIEAPESYQIKAEIKKCDIDGENNEYATLKADGVKGSLFFTYNVSTPLTYLFTSNKVFASFNGTVASNFTAEFSVAEEQTTTTTEMPTTTYNYPTPGVNESDSITVYIAGKEPREYDNETQTTLKLSLLRMAETYCESEKFPLKENLTYDNIQIQKLTSCPFNYPDRRACISLRFAIPVILLEDADSVWTGYQINTEHLEIMWLRYSSTFLPAGLTVYKLPDFSLLKWGLITSATILMLFFIALLAINFWSTKASNYLRRKKVSGTTSIITGSDRNSQLSLPPHYLQQIPALFESVYPMYNPEKESIYQPVIGEYNFSNWDNDDHDDFKDKNKEKHTSVV